MGKNWHPRGGKAIPHDNTDLVLHEGHDYGGILAREKYSNAKIDVHGMAITGGYWKKVFSIANPLGKQTYEY